MTKTKNLTLFLALVLNAGTMFAGGSVIIDGFAYRFNQTSLTAELVRSGNSYSGDIVIPESVVYNEITYPVGSIEESAFYGCTGITSVTIPNSVTYISSTAFCGCTGLTSMTIPNGVKDISGSAFSKCTNLNAIIVATDNDYYSSVKGVLFDKSKTKIVIYPGGKQGGYTIPNSVTTIGKSAFDGCIGLTSVTIPHGVTKIEQSAFYSCTGLTSITIANSVTKIGDHAFCDCSGLTAVTIGNSVTSIGRYVFYNCTSLASVTVLATTPPSVEREAFSNVSKTIPLYVPAGSVSAYQGWGGFTNIQPISAGSADVTTNTISDIRENSVDISWPQVTGANQYVIEIRFNNVLVYTITFNSQGQLLSIVNGAPSLLRDRENTAAQALSNGWKYTVSSLDADKTYTYSVIAKNSGGTTIDTKTGTFKTLPLSGLEEILSAPNATDSKKILIDGQIYILRDGKAYDLTGKSL